MRSHFDQATTSFRATLGLIILACMGVVLLVAHATMGGQSLAITTAREPVRMVVPLATSPLQQPTRRTAGTQQSRFYPANSCVIAAVNGENFANQTVDVDRGTVIGLGGWLANERNRTIGRHAWIVLDGEGGLPSLQAPIVLRDKRPDVQQALGGARGYAYAGFIVDISSSAMATGVYHAYIVFESRGIYYTCDNGRHLRIRRAGHAGAEG